MARCLDVNKFGLFPGQLGVFFFGGPGKRSKYPVRSSFQVPQERKWRALSNYSPNKKKGPQSTSRSPGRTLLGLLKTT